MTHLYATAILLVLVEAAKKISSKFDDNYWLDLDLKSEFPSEFYNEHGCNF